MSTDLRALMHSLAEEAPTVESHGLAERTYRAGRQRRVVRQAAASTTSAIALLLMLSTALFVGPSPLASRYGSSGGTVVTGHPTRIGHQFPILGLPSRPGPLAGLLRDFGNHWYAFSASGHRWRLPTLASTPSGQPPLGRPTLSDDGRRLGYLDPHGYFVIRDLTSGSSTRFPGFGVAEAVSGYDVDPYLPAFFSPDDRYLAMPGSKTHGSLSGVIVLDSTNGDLYSWQQVPYEGDFLAGWASDDQLALLDRARLPHPVLEVRDLHGAVVRSTALDVSGDLGGNEGWDVLSADKRAVDVIVGGTAQNLNSRVASYDVATGALLRTMRLPAPAMNCSWADGARDVVVASQGAGGDVSLARVDSGSMVAPVATVARSLQAQCVELAGAAASGPPHRQAVLDWITDHLVADWVYLVALFAALAATVLGVRHLRRLTPEAP